MHRTTQQRRMTHFGIFGLISVAALMLLRLLGFFQPQLYRTGPS